MSAEILHRAASLMRSRAETATPGPWGTSWDKQVIAAYGSPSDGEQLADAFDSADNAAHIASMHPTVALAVADWLDETAREFEADPSDCCGDDTGSCGSWFCAQVAKGVAVAVAYLSESAMPDRRRTMDWVDDLPHEAPALAAMAEARGWHLPLSERAARVRGLERDQLADACDKSEQELREEIARQIEGMADHLGMHGLGNWPIGERAGLCMAARIARDLDHFRMVCPDCTSQVAGISPTLAEQYADAHRAKGHAPRIEDEREEPRA